VGLIGIDEMSDFAAFDASIRLFLSSRDFPTTGATFATLPRVRGLARRCPHDGQSAGGTRLLKPKSFFSPPKATNKREIPAK
jgi:hypothetical protein